MLNRLRSFAAGLVCNDRGASYGKHTGSHEPDNSECSFSPSYQHYSGMYFRLHPLIRKKLCFLFTNYNLIRFNNFSTLISFVSKFPRFWSRHLCMSSLTNCCMSSLISWVKLGICTCKYFEDIGDTRTQNQARRLYSPFMMAC